LDEAEADRVHHHLQLTLPRIERDEARARIAAKIAARQVCFQRSARSTQVAPLEARRIALLIIGAIYAAPTLLAFRRNHPNRWIILVINVSFGGTIIGWGIALVWAKRAAHRVGSTSPASTCSSTT
jgi:hypothetical protein